MILLSKSSGVKSPLRGSRAALPHSYLAVNGMVNFGEVIEVDENQVGPRMVAAWIDDGGRANPVEIGSGKLGAFVDVPVQRQAGLVFLDPTPHGLAADVAAIQKHIAVGVERRGVD